MCANIPNWSAGIAFFENSKLEFIQPEDALFGGSSLKIRKRLMGKLFGKVGRDSRKNFCNSSREAQLRLEIHDLLPIGRLPQLKEPHARNKRDRSSLLQELSMCILRRKAD